MKKFEIPAIEVLAFSVEDVVTTSAGGGGGLGENELPPDRN